MADKRVPSLRSHFPTRHKALAREIDALGRAVDSPSTILILGESGTGKDRLARAIHDVSSRAASPFVRVDAANLSDELFESELFGHERGAFTGAVASKRGLLEVAEAGTVYLDEVSSLSPAAQAKFLRVLQEKSFRRLAGVVPGMDGLLKAAPTGGKQSALDVIAGQAGAASGLGAIAGVASQLSKLGLKPEQIAKLAPTVIKAVESKGGAEIASLLAAALK